MEQLQWDGNLYDMEFLSARQRFVLRPGAHECNRFHRG
jgi:hypothetical protein